MLRFPFHRGHGHSARHQDLVRGYFDDCSDEWLELYKRDHDVRYYWLDHRRELVVDALGERGGKVLDIGCGPGVITRDLLERGFEVWGIDVSSEMIALARKSTENKNLNDRAHFSVGDINNLEFENSFFDIVLCVGVFSYLQNPEVACREIARVLKDNGKAVITVPTKRVAFCLIKALLETLCRLFPRAAKVLPELTVRPFHHRKYRPWDLNKILFSTELKIVDYMHLQFNFFPIDFLSPRLSFFIARKLDVRLMKSTVFGWLGKGYLVWVEK